MSRPDWITPEFLRSMTRHLWNGTDYKSAATAYLCHAAALEATGTRNAEQADFFSNWLNGLGFLGRDGYTLPVSELKTSRRRQTARFMLCELLALAIEDNAL